MTLLGNNLEFIPERAYHDFVVTAAGPPRSAFVTAPDALETIFKDCWETYPRGSLKNRVLKPLFGNSLGSAERDDWRWQRRAVAPLFRHAELLQYGDTVREAADDVIAGWRSADLSRSRPINEDMLQAAFHTITNTILAGCPDGFLEEVRRGHDDYFAGVNWWIAYAMFGLPSWAPRPGGDKMRAHERRIRKGMSDIVKARRAHAGDETDMLARWIAASDPETGRQLSDELLTDNMVSLLVSGYETAALTLIWALYLLATHPEWQDRINEEIDSVVGDQPVTSAHVKDLSIVQQVINETLRLYPPSPVLVRDLAKTVEIDGQSLKRGATIFVPLYALHRHRKLWDDPDAFLPDRFDEAGREKMHRYQFLPFGAGPRVCIGSSFAMIETTMLLASFVRAASFSIDPGFVPTPTGRTVLVPAEGMPMRVELRAGR